MIKRTFTNESFYFTFSSTGRACNQGIEHSVVSKKMQGAVQQHAEKKQFTQ